MVEWDDEQTYTRHSLRKNEELLKERYKDTDTKDLLVSLWDKTTNEIDYGKVTGIIRRTEEGTARVASSWSGNSKDPNRTGRIATAARLITRAAEGVHVSLRDQKQSQAGRDEQDLVADWTRQNGYFNNIKP